MNGLFDVEFVRPWALALLAVPLALLFLSLRRRAARIVATSDLEVWRAADASGGAPRPRAPRRLNLALLLALFALGCAALALAEPRAREGRARWIGVLDTSASMWLPDGDTTRRERAIDAARLLAAAHGAELAQTSASLFPVAFDAKPDSTVEPQLFPRSEQRAAHFASWDVPGALWITDAIPAERPLYAGFVASGGAAVPGPVGVDGADRLDWDGERIVRRAGGASVRRVLLERMRADDPDEPLARVVTAWASARGVAIASGAVDELEIVLRIVVGRQFIPGDVVAGRDGWYASGERYEIDTIFGGRTGNLTPWLRAGVDTLVATRPGLVEVTWLPGEPDDAAAFAVSWAQLFDDTSLCARGVVPLAERVPAGDPGEALPAPVANTHHAAWAWILAAIAVLFALLALLARSTSHTRHA